MRTITAKQLVPDPNAAAMPLSIGVAAEMAEIICTAFAEEIARLEGIISRQGEMIAELRAQPVMKYVGVWRPDQPYAEASVCTHAGSMWFLNVDGSTQKPGGGSDWTLSVKRGGAPKG